MKPGTHVIVRGVGSGTVQKVEGGYVHVLINGHQHPYLARTENVTPLATPMGKGEIEEPTQARLMGARA